MADIRSPTVPVSILGLELSLSVAPATIYDGDTFTGSGLLQNYDGVSYAPEPGRPVEFLNTSYTPELVLGSATTGADGTYSVPVVADIGVNVEIGTNDLQSRSYW